MVIFLMCNILDHYNKSLDMNRSSTSPYRPTGTTAPRPNANNESLELLIRSLERQNTALAEQLNVYKQKSKKAVESEEKNELILRHNDNLLKENEKMAKLINQKKNEVQVWKNKYETQAANRSANSEIQARKLINEVQRYKQELNELQHLKNMQINELKSQNQLEIQALKRHHLSNNEKYELEIRKLKEYNDKKDFQLSDNSMKFVRLSKETDFEIAKLKEEKDRLRNDLHFEEMEHKKEVDSLKAKFDYNFTAEIESLKKQHLNQIEALDYENQKLKEVINSKNAEIEQILAKNAKVRNNYEDSIELLKNENTDLKEKIFETERIADVELENLREKLDGIKESELTLLNNAHRNQSELQQREILRLQDIIEGRNEELETLSKEKAQVRQTLEAEIVRARAELEAQINENRDQAVKFEEDLKLCDLDLKSKNEELKTIETYLQSQVNTLKGENAKLSELLDRKTESLDKEREEHYHTKRTLEVDLQSTKDKLANTAEDLERETKKSNNELDDVKKINELKTSQLLTKIKGLQEENQEKDSLIAELRETIALKEKEIKASNEKILKLQRTESELRREAKENLARWQAKESQYNSLVKSQTQGSERARKRQLQQLKNIQQNKLNSLKHQIKQYQRHIQDKNLTINDLKRQYEDLVNKFEEVFSQRAAQKNLDIKIPGWIPDTIATKNTFDVFLKNKVLEYCS